MEPVKIKVPVLLREDALSHGARFVDNSSETDQLLGNESSGYWMVPEDLSPENKEYLLSHFSTEEMRENDLLWEKAVESGHTLEVLSLFNGHPLPGAVVLEKMFNLFKRVNSARKAPVKTELSKEFPVNYDTLCEYSKEFNDSWGLGQVSEIANRAGISSIDDIFGVIDSSNIPAVEKAFLRYFFS